MKKQMEASFLFRSTDVFYPQGSVSSTQDYPRLEKAQLISIQRDLSQSISQLEATHKKLARVVDDLKPSVSMKLQLLDERLPWTSVDAKGTLRLDVKVVQAVFRASLIDGLDAVTLLGSRPRRDSPAVATNRVSSEQSRIDEFLSLKAEVRAAKGRTLVGSILSSDLRGDDWNEKGWFRMVDLVSRSQPVHSHYYGTLLFLFAHEMGHLAMGHLTNHLEANATAEQCQALHEREFDADTYALVLLVKTFPQLFAIESTFGGIATSVFGGQGMFGYEDFFKYAYDLAGYEAFAKASACNHPAKAERLERLEKFRVSLANRAQDAFWEKAIKEEERKNKQ